MNNNKSKFTIIIPARNEECVILDTLNILKKNVQTPHSTIVINDRSTDNTLSIAEKYCRSNKSVKVYSTTSKTNGFSSAIKLGVDKANTDLVVVVMADLCDEVTTIDKMYKKINNGWDIVCGSRYIKGGKKRGGPVLQGFFSKMVCESLYYFGLPTKDVSNAFKMYKKRLLNDIVFNTDSGVEASMEITLQMFFKGAKIIDLPTKWKGRTIGKSKFKIIQRAPKYIKIYFWALNNMARKSLGLKYNKYKSNGR